MSHDLMCVTRLSWRRWETDMDRQGGEGARRGLRGLREGSSEIRDLRSEGRSEGCGRSGFKQDSGNKKGRSDRSSEDCFR